MVTVKTDYIRSGFVGADNIRFGSGGTFAVQQPEVINGLGSICAGWLAAAARDLTEVSFLNIVTVWESPFQSFSSDVILRLWALFLLADISILMWLFWFNFGQI